MKKIKITNHYLSYILRMKSIYIFFYIYIFYYQFFIELRRQR